MGIRIAVEGIVEGLDQFRLRNSGTHRGYMLPLTCLFEDLAEVSLKVEPAVQGEIRVNEIDDVGFAGLEQVRIDPGSHERGDGNGFSAHVLGEITDLAGGGDNVQRVAVGSGTRWWSKGSIGEANGWNGRDCPNPPAAGNE
jgi:hypothetical protein